MPVTVRIPAPLRPLVGRSVGRRVRARGPCAS